MVSTKNALRLMLLFAAMLAGVLLDVTDAYAQAACDQLNRQLQTLERNGDFRNYGGSSQQSRQLAADLQNQESAYVRTGCNDDAKAGRTLSRDCQALARQIIRGRAQQDGLTKSVSTANAVAQQRESVLQDMARFGCQSGSRATFTQQDRSGTFNQLFGGYTQDPNAVANDGQYQDGDVVGDQFSGYGGYSTIRTVCVRLTDGYFWPISYSTLPDYLADDIQKCQAACPGTQVDLYYYNNPGQEPEDMVNAAGGTYRSLPNAFAYRKAFDLNSSCKQEAPKGFVTIAGGDPGGSGARADVEFGGQSFPLPLRDPRMPVTTATTATATPMPPPQVVASIDIPLPRPRPNSSDPTAPQNIAAPTPTPQERVVKFGDKTVRIVGPDTPYAQLAGAEP